MSPSGRSGLDMTGTSTAEATHQGISVRFWGVRGSFTVADHRARRYGGNTACVEVRIGDEVFVIDAGSGIIGLGQVLAQEGHERVELLMSHLHHDHIAGLAFFEPLFHQNRTVRIHCGHLDGKSAKAALDRMFDQPLFPLRLADLPGVIEHVGFKAGETLQFPSGTQVRTCRLDHPGGATAYRFDHAGRSLCYVSDVEHPADGPDPDLCTFVAGADLVIYDTTYTEEEYEGHVGWGHSTWQSGVALCKAAGAKALAAFHHHPFRDDAQLDAIEAELAEALPGSFVAREVQSLTLATPADYPYMIGV